MKKNFGPWEFDSKYMTLTYVQYGYEIDLDEVNTSAEMLDWIFQIWHKDWGKASMPHLLNAFDWLFDPQANLCSWGSDHKINPVEVIKQKVESRKPLRAT